MKADIQTLLDKYSKGECTEPERRLLEAWFIKIGEQRSGEEPDDLQIQAIWRKLESTSLPPKAKQRPLWRRYAAIAASVLIVVGVGLSLLKPKYFDVLGISAPTAHDIAAATDKATLTLHSGEKIALDGLHVHTVLEQVGIEIVSGPEGEIIYRQLGQTSPLVLGGEPLYHTIETPRGGKYHIQLSDGSKVWLNAQSSLTFPARFTQMQRRVRLTGEAFFDVAKVTELNAGTHVPFLVDTHEQQVEVLGTQFNIKNYRDDDLQYTTLVEGSVRVEHFGQTGGKAILRPGQQAQSGKSFVVVDADMEREIAWRNGDFVYKKETLDEICKQISRWYDIDITYPREISGMQFTGMIKRSQPLSVIIRMIESAGQVKATLKERRLTITKTS